MNFYEEPEGSDPGLLYETAWEIPPDNVIIGHIGERRAILLSEDGHHLVLICEDAKDRFPLGTSVPRETLAAAKPAEWEVRYVL